MLPYADGGARSERPLHKKTAKPVLDVGLHGTLQRTCAILGIVALGSDKILGLVGHLDGISHFFHTLENSFQLYVDDAFEGFPAQLVERDDLVQAVEELGRELLARLFWITVRA